MISRIGSIYSPTKPPVGTQIDWTDPLSQGLVVCDILNGQSVNLVNNKRGAQSGGILLSNGYETVSGATNNRILYTGVQLATEELTMFAVFRKTGAMVNTGSTILSIAAASTAVGQIGQDWTDGSLKFNIYTSSGWNNATPAGTPIVNNVLTSVAGVSTKTTMLTYLQGKQYSTKAKNYILPCVATINAATLNSAMTTPGNTNYPYVVYLVLIYNRALSASEIQRLHELTKGW